MRLFNRSLFLFALLTFSSESFSLTDYQIKKICKKEKMELNCIRNNSNNETISIDIHLNRSHAKYVYELLIDGCKILNI